MKTASGTLNTPIMFYLICKPDGGSASTIPEPSAARTSELDQNNPEEDRVSGAAEGTDAGRPTYTVTHINRRRAFTPSAGSVSQLHDT